MATLVNLQTQQRCLLQSHHTVGRLNSSVNTLISDSYISKIHAFIEWNGEHWLLRDVSSNGTWLNGNRLSMEQIAKLDVGDEIAFASKETHIFTLADINPPCDCLVPVEHNSEAIELEFCHLLESKQSQPMILSYNNNTYSWWQEILDDNLNQPTKTAELSDQSMLTVDGLIWQLQINRSIEDTQILRPTITSIDEIIFEFHTSLDEESTQLRLQSGEQNIDLLLRSHHYLTLTLARQRAHDIKVGLDDSEQGWVYAEHLAKDLGLEAGHLNIQIYRIRKQFIDALNNCCETSNIIERSAGKLRFAGHFFCIYKGDSIECDTRQGMSSRVQQNSTEHNPTH